jgi:dihydroflavonol-4-reductase
MDFVTGGTGFVGAHVVRALLRRGRAVRCLVRPSSRRDNLRELPVELAEGDLRDPESLRAALVGCETVFHCAADYRLYSRDPSAIYETNVRGTGHLFEAASSAGVRRVVFTSSVGALGRAPAKGAANEATPVTEREMIGHYKRSKFRAEELAREWARRGLPVVIVNPSTPVGEYDIKPTPTGKMIVDFLNRRMPAYVETGLNLVDVRDVAEGHLLAADKGRPGERYILGNRNMSLKEILDTLAQITGLPAPRVRLPLWVPLAAAAADTAVSRLIGREPRVPLEAARMSLHRMYFDSSRAVAELGLPQSPVEGALARAVGWYRENGYVRA